jgi:peptidoglycan/xylan/chitin deacetylase (PgdA/CDA1 family)
MKTFKDMVRGLLYGLGLLSLIHRLRNRRTLTVLMFHRVLPPDTAAFQNAEREFTFSVAGFGRCLDFVQKHYEVVALADLAHARAGIKPLPNNAALITFDDGWRDTLMHALPELRRRNLQALLFVATEIPALREPRWWQDALVTVLADSRAKAKLTELLRPPNQSSTVVPPLSPPQINALLAALPPEERMRLLADVCSLVDLPRQMLSAAELAALQGDTFTLGAHGHSHAPLTHVADPMRELVASCQWLKSTHSVPLSMSFPHGAHNQNLVQLAREAGFQWLFTSDPVLVPTDAHATDALTLGRIHIPENQWTCAGGKISYPRLATFLFFRPKATVQ